MDYAMTLNPAKSKYCNLDCGWLLEFVYELLEEHIKFPPKELVELIKGAQHLGKQSYKMPVLKALELKEQLIEITIQGFTQPSVS